MKYSDAFPSNFLKCDDLQRRQVPVTIESYDFEEIGDEKKLVLRFRGKQKGLVCNKTNAGSIAQLYGDELDDWVGKRIVLYPTTTPFNGRATPCIRVLPPSNAPAATPEPEPAPEPAEDDKIPF